MDAIRILLIDDHAIVRDALSGQLSSVVEFDVVGTAPDAGEGMAAAFELKPDVVVMDIDMPGMICFDAAERIKGRLEDVKILFLSSFSILLHGNGNLTPRDPSPRKVLLRY